MESKDEAARRAARWKLWATLVGWYSIAGALSMLSGRFAASPWPIAAVLFGGLEVTTFFAAMYEDGWANDFRGDREIMVRGTVANALVIVAFTAAGLSLR